MPFSSRYIQKYIAEDLDDKKMVFVGGPRQVGKTTLSLSFLNPPTIDNPAYLNWDSRRGREIIQKSQIPPVAPCLVFDEVHKYPRWRNLLKGWHDTLKDRTKILVTGSARLDQYKKGGDSLFGRYHYYRLHPLSLLEISKSPNKSDLQDLLKFGGFPEPFFNANDKTRRRWSNERLDRVTHEDIRDLHNLKDISKMQLLMETLPSRVGSTLSIQNLREDLEAAHDSVDRWVRILEQVYFCYRIPPFGTSKLRAVKKEQKLYLWDFGDIENPGTKFENLVANQLLKYCHFLEDSEGYRMDLRFFRDVDMREVDFVVMKNKKPIFAVECKTGEKNISSSLSYLSKRTAGLSCYQIHLGSKDYIDKSTGIRLLPFITFCREMNFP